MTESRSIVLGTTTFVVPPLPIRHNRVIYPLCRELSAIDGPDDREAFLARVWFGKGQPQFVKDEEWPKLEEIAFYAACAADTAFTRDAFDDLPITPGQLIDAFFIARVQTGAWPTDSGLPTGDDLGEAKAEDSPSP